MLLPPVGPVFAGVEGGAGLDAGEVGGSEGGRCVSSEGWGAICRSPAVPAATPVGALAAGSVARSARYTDQNITATRMPASSKIGRLLAGQPSQASGCGAVCPRVGWRRRSRIVVACEVTVASAAGLGVAPAAIWRLICFSCSFTSRIADARLVPWRASCARAHRVQSERQGAASVSVAAQRIDVCRRSARPPRR